MTSNSTKAAFGQYIVTLPTTSINAQRECSKAMQMTSCYKQIASSLEHVGLIEPLVVFEQSDGKFLLLDGNTRFAILKERGTTEIPCILASDDEAYTYNRRVSYVPPIAQHFMLLKVLENGVSEERIATALNVDLRTIREKKDLLKGICPEVIKLLGPRRLSVKAFSTLRKMKPLRQIESAEHMIASNRFSIAFIKAILQITRPEMLVSPPGKAAMNPQDSGDRSLLEREHEGLVRDLKGVEKSLGVEMLTLAVSLKYLERIMKNVKVKRYLERAFPETFVVLVGLLQETQAGEMGRLGSASMHTKTPTTRMSGATVAPK
jgi:RepB plasmid partitioning protein/ParB-like nuclease domain